MSIPGVRVNVNVRVRVHVHFHIFVHVQSFLIIYAACMLQPKIRKIAKIVIVSPFNSPTVPAQYRRRTEVLFTDVKSRGSRPWIFPSFKNPGSRPSVSSLIFHAIHKHEAKISRFSICRIFFHVFCLV